MGVPSAEEGRGKSAPLGEAKGASRRQRSLRRRFLFFQNYVIQCTGNDENRSRYKAVKLMVAGGSAGSAGRETGPEGALSRDAHPNPYAASGRGAAILGITNGHFLAPKLLKSPARRQTCAATGTIMAGVGFGLVTPQTTNLASARARRHRAGRVLGWRRSARRLSGFPIGRFSARAAAFPRDLEHRGGFFHASVSHAHLRRARP